MPSERDYLDSEYSQKCVAGGCSMRKEHLPLYKYTSDKYTLIYVYIYKQR